ncbi:hypothetical protein COCNU_06G012410 [Cocos nucifera]|uniref:Uncharacterized protein n=1 Tax=Cocos nucifera TaxID=13894 RepID=A0A8K0ICM0_COCNU|nr:hypothetical protein COCNU_06G012410 [Cocos nucifera]
MEEEEKKKDEKKMKEEKKKREEVDKRVQEEKKKEEDKKKREHEERKIKEEKKVMEKKKMEEEERKREEEKKVEMKEEKNKEEDKPKMPTYSLERRIKKENRIRKTSHPIEDLNYEIRMPTKKTKIESKSKKVSFLDLSNISSIQQNEDERFIEHSYEYQGKGSLSKEDDGIIEMFFEIIFNNAEVGSITRSNLYDLLFAWMIIDDIIDTDQNFLRKK